MTQKVNLSKAQGKDSYPSDIFSHFYRYDILKGAFRRPRNLGK